jgi:hypothetical protein
MDFKMAETIVNMSLLFNRPSILVIGDNGIGKTEMIKAMAKRFAKNALVERAIDYGGLQQKMPLIKKSLKTIVLTDLQNVLSRKAGVRNATLGYMSAIMTEGEEDSMTFNAQEGVKTKNINFIIAGTPQHVLRLIQLGQNDFLNRFIVCIVERAKKDFKKEKFALDFEPVLKYDHALYKKHNNKIFKGLSQRHNQMVNDLVTELDTMGHNGQEFVNKAKPYFFDIRDTVFGSRNVTTFLRPISLEEEPDEVPVESQQTLKIDTGTQIPDKPVVGTVGGFLSH